MQGPHSPHTSKQAVYFVIHTTSITQGLWVFADLGHLKVLDLSTNVLPFLG
jgi:hypothetical protein